MSRVGHIQEATIIDETDMPLSDADNSWLQWVARQADKLTSGNRGSWVTEAIILAQYANDNSQLRAAYEQDKDAIDNYFQNVDVQKIINDAGPGIQKDIKKGMVKTFKNNVPGFLAGTIVAAGSIIAIKKYQSSDD